MISLPYRTISKYIFIILDKGKRKERGGYSAVGKRKLNYRFHNPNTAEVTAEILLKVLIEANSEKVNKAVQEAAERLPDREECHIGHSA